MKRNTKECKICGRSISLSNIGKHEKACQGHSILPRPSREEVLEKKRRACAIARAAKGKPSPAKIKEMAKKISLAHKRGCYDRAHEALRGKPGRPQSEETKRKLSEKAKLSKHRRLRKGIKEYCGVLLDSSWEVSFAQWLDSNSISWKRPDPLEYDGRHYFPDFYLSEFDLFVDVKNDYLILTDSEKVKKAAEQNSVEILILSKKDLQQLGVM
jgi:hypothetical protein